MTAVQAPSTFEHEIVISRCTGTDRTTIKRLRRIDPQNFRLMEEVNRKKCERHCPAGLSGWIAERDELIKESK
jgi:hypothetical protein